jgi:hypothetical protein
MTDCNSSKKVQSSKSILASIYNSQKLYYNVTLDMNQDFTGLLAFSSKGRTDLYNKNKVDLGSTDSCIILEGFSPGWGKYIGFLITSSQIWYYTKNGTSEWTFNKIVFNSPDFEQKTGLSQNLVQTIQSWDTTYINSLKKQVGNIVHDGYSFWANKIENIKSNPVIYNYTFYQYPVK